MLFENLLGGNQNDYLRNANHDPVYMTGQPGPSTTLYDQQLAGYNASVMKGGKKTRRGTRRRKNKTKGRRRISKQ